MKQAGMLIVALLATFMATGVLAEQHEKTFDQKTFDYEKGDYSLITDWNSVDFALIPPLRIPDVPPEKLIYAKLSSVQRMEMTTNQIIEHLADIQDLSQDVDKELAEQALKQEYNVFVTLNGRAHIDDSGMLRSLGAVVDSIPLHKLSPKANVFVLSDGTIQVSQETKPPKEGTFEFVVEDKREINFFGTTAAVKGSFIVNNGEINVYEFAIVDGIYITSAQGGVAIAFAASDAKNSKDTILFDKQAKTISLTKTWEADNIWHVDFHPSNQYLLVEEDDMLILTPRSGEFFIRQRESLIPKISASDGSEMVIYNGANSVEIINGDIIDLSPTDPAINAGKESVPLVVSTSRTSNDQQPSGISIIFDNNNDYIVPKEGYPIYNFECLECADRLAANPEATALVKMRLASVLPSVVVYFTASSHGLRIMHDLADRLEELHPTLRNSISVIHILSSAEIRNTCGPNANACVEGQTMYLPFDGKVLSGTDESVVRHEAAHTLTHKVEPTPEAQQAKLFELSLARKYFAEEPLFVVDSPDCKETSCFRGLYSDNQHIPISEEDTKEWLRLQASLRQGRVLSTEWGAIAGDVYGRDLIRHYGSSLWDDMSYGPRNGCVTPYGCKNWKEDIAEYSELFSTDDQLTNFITVNIPHLKPGGAMYDPRYEQKIRRLYDFGFITDEEYQLWNKLVQETALDIDQRIAE